MEDGKKKSEEMLMMLMMGPADRLKPKRPASDRERERGGYIAPARACEAIEGRGHWCKGH